MECEAIKCLIIISKKYGHHLNLSELVYLRMKKINYGLSCGEEKEGSLM